jgi:Outer membrane protein beta-barrel domain
MQLRWRSRKGKKVKKILLTTTGLIALGMAPAIAADLPARTYTKAPAAAMAINNWTGFYIGAMGGYAKENTSDIGAISGGFAGGTVGYNWQSGNLVFGIEADAAWSDVGVSASIPGLASASDKIRDMGTARGRIGYAFDQVLIYGTGARRKHFGQPHPFRLGRWRRCRGHVRTEMVGQGRVPLSQLRKPELFHRRDPGRRCDRNAQSEQRSARRELSLLGLLPLLAQTPPLPGTEAFLRVVGTAADCCQEL